MKTEYQKISATDLKLSFDFEITNHQNRVLDIRLNGTLRKLKFESNYFAWFMEDLIYLLDKNRYQKRWDYALIKVSNIASLKLSANDETKFKEQFKSVTNFDLEAL